MNRMSSGPRDRGPNLKESKPEPREKCPNFKSMEETKPGPREKGPNFKAWRDRHQSLDQDKRVQKFFIYFFFPLPMAVHVHVGSPSGSAAIDWRNSAEAYLKVGACQQGEHIWGSPRVCFLLVKPEKKTRGDVSMGKPQTRGFTLLFRPQKKEDKMLEKQKKLLDVCFISSRLAAHLHLEDRSLIQRVQLSPPLASIQVILVSVSLPKGLLCLMGSRPKKAGKKIFKIHTPKSSQTHSHSLPLVYNTRIQPSHENTLQYYRNEKNGCKMQI